MPALNNVTGEADGHVEGVYQPLPEQDRDRTKSLNSIEQNNTIGDPNEDNFGKIKRERRALCCSMLSLMLSIPALIGA